MNKAELLKKHNPSDIRWIIEDMIESHNNCVVIDFLGWGDCLNTVDVYATVKVKYRETNEVCQSDIVLDPSEINDKLKELYQSEEC